MFYTHSQTLFSCQSKCPQLTLQSNFLSFSLGSHKCHYFYGWKSSGTCKQFKKKEKKKKSNHMAYESKIGWTESAYTFAMRVSKAHQLFLELVKSYRLRFSSHHGTAITAGGSSPQSTLQKLFREKVFQLKVQSVIYPCTQCL